MGNYKLSKQEKAADFPKEIM